jgi:hypothetical protein
MAIWFSILPFKWHVIHHYWSKLLWSGSSFVNQSGVTILHQVVKWEFDERLPATWPLYQEPVNSCYSCDALRQPCDKALHIGYHWTIDQLISVIDGWIPCDCETNNSHQIWWRWWCDVVCYVQKYINELIAEKSSSRSLFHQVVDFLK